MNSVRKIVKNSGASLLTQISTPASSFVLVFLIAKFEGVYGLGIFSSALAILYIFQAFASLGFQHFITREVAQDKSKASKFLVNASLLGCIFSTLMAGLMCFVINLITSNVELIRAVYLLSISLVPYTLGLVCQSISRGFEKFEHITIAAVTGNAFKCIIGGLFLFKGYGFIKLMYVISGSQFLIFFISLYLTLRKISEHQKISVIDFVFCKWILRSIPVFAFIFIIAAVRMNINTVILTSMMGEKEVGFFSAAYKLVTLFSIGIGFYILAIQPVIFRLFKSSLEKFKLVFTESIRYFFILFLPLIVGTLILSEKFILLIFKEEFLPSALVLRILIWLLMLNGFNQIFANVLIASNNQKVNLKGNIIGMVSNIGISLLLIPNFSFIGAAVANVASTFITLIYQKKYVSELLIKINYFKLALKPAIAAALIGTLIFLLNGFDLILLIITATIVYSISLFALKVFSDFDIEIIRKLWKGDKDFHKLTVPDGNVDKITGKLR